MQLSRLFVSAAATVLVLGSASAKELKPLSDGFPNRPISAVVPYGPGGGADQVTRAITAAISSISTARFQVENKPGGGGLAAMPDYLSRPADGYTFLEHDDGLISGIAAGLIDLTPGKELEPICAVQSTFGQVYIRPDEKRFTDWKSFVDFVRANPGTVSMANSAAPGAMEAVQTAALERLAGLKTRQIGFDKPPERYGALIGGHADSLFEQPGDVQSFIANKQMKPILTLLPTRPAEFADIPSLTDVGLDAVPDLRRVRMFWVHAAAPLERKSWLRQACAAAYETKSFQDFNRKQFMHIGRSYYDWKDALSLVNDTIAAFRKSYAEMGLFKK